MADGSAEGEEAASECVVGCEFRLEVLEAAGVACGDLAALEEIDQIADELGV
jgi:hypothetical protein